MKELCYCGEIHETGDDPLLKECPNMPKDVVMFVPKDLVLHWTPDGKIEIPRSEAERCGVIKFEDAEK